MSHARTYAKPRLAGRGFAQSTWRLVASLSYSIGLAGATAQAITRIIAAIAMASRLLSEGSGASCRLLA